MIFPIIAANGRVIGFGARVLNNDDKPKYINTGDTLLYNKRNNLYGLKPAKERKLNDLVMVEGYTDVIDCSEAGVTNAVASLGTALTQQQAKRRYQTLVLTYTSPTMAMRRQNATIRGLTFFRRKG